MSRWSVIVASALCVSAGAPSAAADALPPTIDVWYGTHQHFGQLGRPQKWINILGNVSDPDGVAFLTYSVNGGPAVPMGIGPDTRRLQRPGDFNADIDADLLIDGLNTVELTARDTFNNVSTQVVTVEYTRGTVWPQAYTIDWSGVGALEDAVQIVDGLWTHDALGLRTVEVGYDRVAALGDLAWAAYEVTVPLTVHSIDPNGFQFPSVAPGVGLVIRWHGHTDFGGNWQPIYGWTPNGATFWYDYGAADGGQFRITGDHGLFVNDPNDHEIEFDVTYNLKLRVEPIDEDTAHYRAKVWPAANPEPPGWAMQGIEGPGDLPTGSLLLIAHHVDATFGNVTVTPLPNPNPPLIVNVHAEAAQTDATIHWSTTELATTEIRWGATPALELGTFSDPALTSAHVAALSDLPPGTLIYYQITAVDESETTGESDVLTFVTRGPGAEFVSDDFSQPDLDTELWTFVDPRGDSSVAMTGRQVALSVPAGDTHDIWSTGIDAARIMQPVKDLDFQVEAKFDSPLSLRYQGQGILVEEDADSVLRVDVFSTGSGLRAFAAHVHNGTATMKLNQPVPGDGRLRLRLTRSASTWQMEYSLDGQAWTTAGAFTATLNVSGIGVYASNSADPGELAPPHTALVDYAFNTDSPIDPEDGGQYELTVDIVGSGAVARDPNLPFYDANTPITLTATPAPGWDFAGWSGAVVGTDNPVVFSLSDDATVLATFTESPGDTEPPVISDVVVSPTHQSVTITWTTDEPASSGYLYGLTEGLELGGDEDLTRVTEHTVTIVNLTPEQSYHFMIFSADKSINVGTHTGQFTTTAPPPSTIVSDDFSGPTLDPNVWTFIDPLGDGSAQLNGAQLVLTAPGGTAHPVWVQGNLAPRIMQTCNDADFEIEIKFDSLPHAGFQYHGVIVEQDAQNFIRFDIQSDGSRASLLAATFLNGAPVIRVFDPIGSVAPQWLRVHRAANTWTVSYSFNGIDWVAASPFNFAMQVTAVGPFAANEDGMGPAPAHASIVDYFFNNASPIVPEDGGNYTVTIEVVGQGAVLRDPNQTLLAPGTPVTLTAVPEPGWVFSRWTGDASGTDNPLQFNIDGDVLVRAAFSEIDLDPPVISDVHAIPSTRSVVITFTTDEPATGRVDYGLTPALELGGVDGAPDTMAHSIALTDLDPNTPYYYAVMATDSAENQSTTETLTFTTDPVVPSTLVSDDFNSPVLDPVWTFVDPLDDAGLVLDGGAVAISVPGGEQHDAWVSGLLSPRIVQSTNDTDFEAIVKFDSPLAAAFQTQGLVAEDGAGNFIRFNLHHNGTSVVLFAATIQNEQATVHVNRSLGAAQPSHLRVTRLEHTWTLSHSFDGVDWTSEPAFVSALKLASVGIFAGNASLGGNPAPPHTALIDFFLNPHEPADPPCPGDCNGDGLRDITDLSELLATFQMSPGACDTDQSGQTDITDLGTLLATFNEPCP